MSDPGHYRGTYRGIYSVLIDHLGFQALSPIARHVLLTLRICPQTNVCCLFRLYRAVLSAQTGYAEAKLDEALQELQTAEWIELDGPIVWIKNGLRYDPTLRLSDPKHLKAVERTLAQFGNHPI